MTEPPPPTDPASGQRLLAEALGEVSAALNSTLELDGVLDLIMDRVASVLPFARGTIMVLDGEFAEVVRAKGFDDPIVGLRLRLSEVANLGRVMSTGESTLVNDIQASAEWTPTAETEDVQSAMTAAIRAGGEVVGAISFDSDQKDTFNAESLARLEAFAGQAGNAIRNARLYQESQRALATIREQRRLTQILADITAELMAQRDVDALLDFILERVSGFVAGAAVTVILINDGMTEVVRTTALGDTLIGERLEVAKTPNLLRIVETGRPRLIGDTRAPDSGWEWTEESSWVRSNLTAPILLGGETIGFLSLSSAEPDAFPAALFQPLETFSTQVGMAIHNARLFDESESARRAEVEQRLLAEALGEVSAALNSTLELDDVLDLILDRVASVVPFSAGTIMMLDGDFAEVVRANGFEDSIVGLRLRLADAGNLERVMATGRPSLIADTESSSEWTAIPENAHIKSAMTAAIRAGGEVVGAISVDSDQKDTFSAESLARLQAFADQAGSAIRNARLYQESQKALASLSEQRRLTEILADITAELMAQRDVDALLDFILARVSGFVAGAAVTVMLIENGDAVVVRTTAGEETLVGQRLNLAETPNLLRIVETGRPRVIGDTRAPDSGWQATDEIAWMRSNLTAPIMLGGETIGFLSLSSGEPDGFPAALFQPLETFSTQVGMAIHNARLFDGSEVARREELEQRLLAEALGEVSAALNSTLELDGVLDLIMDRVASVLPFARGTIMVLDGEFAEVVRAKGFDDPIVGLRLRLSEVANLGRVMSTGESTLVNDIQASAEWTPTAETEDVQSAMTAAIRAGGEVVGAISFDSDQKDTFNAESLARLEAFAGQAGNAIRNARLYQESQEARRQSDELLRVILPEQIAEELKTSARVRARRHEDVAVLFADIVGFTTYCDSHDPEDVMEALTEITQRFEEIAERHGLEKLKTIGDSFMATAGLLELVLNPDLQCVKAGLDMVEATRGLASGWTVRVGIHSGDLIAGVLGSKKFLFDVWGDTVNTASRVESNGVPSGVSVSSSSWHKVSHACRGESRGKVAVKGKGEMEMFLVEGLR